jgi:L-threonine kinase
LICVNGSFNKDSPTAITMNSTAHGLNQIPVETVSPAARRLSPVAAPKRWVAGKVGEWLQGVDRDGAPIVYAMAVHSSPFRTMTWLEPAERLTVLINPDAPADSAKVQKAIKELTSSYKSIGPSTYRITITGSPPRGKGLGSSSVDIASSLLAIKNQRGLRISAPELFQLMCRVERSDYLFNPELIVAANPSDGSCEAVARAPNCIVLAWDTDPNTAVDTQAVLHLDITRRSFSDEYQELSSMIRSGDPERLLGAATRSAELNDRVLPKIGFYAARKLVKELQNVGLIAAHTGTILGFVLPEPVDKDLQKYLRDFVVDRYSAAPMIFEVGAPSAERV